jgi:Flp pilus assembly protein TadG
MKLHDLTQARRRRGQALVEFALTLPLMLVVIISVVNFMPAITTRGIILDISETATQQVSRYLPALYATAADDRTILCNQLLDIVRSEVSSELGAAAVTGGAGQGCTGLVGGKLSPTAGANPVVWVAAINPGTGNPDTGYRMLQYTTAGNETTPRIAVAVEVCVSYLWKPQGGIMYLAMNTGTTFSQVIINTFTYRFCGHENISSTRSR